VIGAEHAVPLVLVHLATLAPGAVATAIVARLVPAYVDLLKQLKVRFKLDLDPVLTALQSSLNL
jgi:hypothetical protein